MVDNLTPPSICALPPSFSPSLLWGLQDFSTSVSSCRHSLTQLDGTLRAVTSHLSTYGAVPVDDASVLALLHHANAVKTLVLSLLASGAAPCVHTVDAFESAHAREASQCVVGAHCNSSCPWGEWESGIDVAMGAFIRQLPSCFYCMGCCRVWL